METVTVDVVDVTDGDTVTVEGAAGGTETVRLWGVDAPETSQPYGPAATKVARKVAGGKRVEVEIKERGTYGRLIGRVWAGDTELAATLVRSGYAWHDRRHAPEADILARHEREARRKGRGLWSQERPTAPWEHRNGSPQGSLKSATRGLVQFVAWTAFFFALILLLVLLAA